jgi:hypothetical protein
MTLSPRSAWQSADIAYIPSTVITMNSVTVTPASQLRLSGRLALVVALRTGFPAAQPGPVSGRPGQLQVRALQRRREAARRVVRGGHVRALCR